MASKLSIFATVIAVVAFLALIALYVIHYVSPNCNACKTDTEVTCATVCKDGLPGKDGTCTCKDGLPGTDGKPGKDGAPGKDGIYVPVMNKVLTFKQLDDVPTNEGRYIFSRVGDIVTLQYYNIFCPIPAKDSTTPGIPGEYSPLRTIVIENKGGALDGRNSQIGFEYAIMIDATLNRVVMAPLIDVGGMVRIIQGTITYIAQPLPTVPVY